MDVTVAPAAPRAPSGEHLVSRLVAAALESLLHAVDANDAETGAHVRRVAALAGILARAADCDGRAQCRVERVALFHDIGKINGALFDDVRLTSRLSAVERRLIATHADRGAQVLAPLASFYPELPRGVEAHHEWWNGRGYPRGLVGEAIPFEARVVAIADVFDALTSPRRYRPAYTVRSARRFIADGRAAQFDPDLTDLFLSPPVQDEVAQFRRDARKVAARRCRAAAAPADGPMQAAPDISFRWRAELDD